MGGGGTNTVTKEVGPEGLAAQRKLLGFADAIGQRSRFDPDAFQFNKETLSPFNSLQMRSLQGEALRANDLRKMDLGRTTLDFGQKVARGDLLNPETNPFIRPTIDMAQRGILENFNEQLLPSLRSGIEGAGGFDNIRRQLLESDLGGRVSKQLGDVETDILGRNYNIERAYMNDAPNLINQGIQLGGVANRMGAQAGAGFQAADQRGLDIGIANFDRDQANITRAYDIALPYLQTVLGGAQGSKTTSPGASKIGSALSGGLGGAATLGALGASISPATAATATAAAGAGGGPLGAGIGGLLGLLAGMLG